MAKPTSRLFACLLLALALGGCSYMPDFMSFPPQVRGNRIDEATLSQLVPGTSTRADVQALLGSPTTRATFDDNTWIYVSEVTRPQIGGTNWVLDQGALAVKFDDNGVLRGIERKTDADAQSVAVVDRTTPSPGSDTSFMSMLLGNVGKFNPVAAGMGTDTNGLTTAGSQGSATNPGNF